MIWRVGVDVRRRDVLLGADQDLDLGEEAAGERLELLLDSFFGSTMTPPLPPPYGMPDDRALPGHPHREGLDLVEAHVLVVADAALGRPAPEVVLDAIAGEDPDRAVVHLHGEVDRQLAAGLAQDSAHALVEVEPLGGQVELLLGDRPRIDVGGNVFGGHGSVAFLVCVIGGYGGRV